MLLSPEDRDLAIRTLFGEAQIDPASQAAVASVILNRANQSGKSVKDVVLAPKQFEPWGSRKKELLGLDPNSADYKNLGTIIDAVASGATPDPTGGATLFYSPTAQTALGRPTPKWAKGEGQDIGLHRFYKGNFPTPPGAAMPTIVAGLDATPGLPTRKPAPNTEIAINTGPKPLSISPAKSGFSPNLLANAVSALASSPQTPTQGGQPQLASSSFKPDMEATAIAMETAGIPEFHIVAVTGLMKDKNGRWVANA